MGLIDQNGGDARIRILVAIASYGTSNDRYLLQLIHEYGSMPFDIDIVVLSNIEKKIGENIECVVGLPNKNPWSLPFGHKKIFGERSDKYDVFIYSEDDILITETNLRAFLDVTKVLRRDEVAGFLRVEYGSNGEPSYPDLHACFHWDVTSVRSRGSDVLAHFTNDHAACYVLTQAQLKRAIELGGFLVAPHGDKYDLLCTAATDPYTQCGMTKLIPVSRINHFTVHHMSNKYVGKMGVDAAEMTSQVEALTRINEEQRIPRPLLNTETNLPRAKYSKDYYEPVSEEVISMIPESARNVLSVGCGWGAIEKALIKKGLRVVAMPLDPVISRTARVHGVETIADGLHDIASFAHRERFDCMLFLNVLHLLPDPERVLAGASDCLSPDAVVILRSPNMLSFRSIRWHIGKFLQFRSEQRFRSMGIQFSSINVTRRWCKRSGLTIDQTIGIFDPGKNGFIGKLSALARKFLPTSVACVFATEFIVRARRQSTNRTAIASDVPSGQDINHMPVDARKSA